MSYPEPEYEDTTLFAVLWPVVGMVVFMLVVYALSFAAGEGKGSKSKVSSTRSTFWRTDR